MWNKIKGAVIAAVVVIAALGGGGAAIARAAGGGAGGEREDGADDRPLTGQALERAGAAALAVTGGGKITETEAGDEEDAYEIEVTRAEGREVDVHLDRRFEVLSSVEDDDEAGEQDGADDD